jgi:hypothetical protein
MVTDTAFGAKLCSISEDDQDDQYDQYDQGDQYKRMPQIQHH